MDKFADIAANGIGGRMDLLSEQLPAKHEKSECILTENISPIKKSVKKSSTRDELYRELDLLREKMKPFLENHAPKAKSYKKRLYIEEFLLNGERTVKIPYYCGPVGYNKDVYEADFNIEKHDDKTYFICFKGADYYAVVYINGVCVGVHEGFFSPFEFDMTSVVSSGINHLKIELYNDHIYMGNAPDGSEDIEGDKLYAATGPGWDDAAVGWHHCPAGSGLFDKVYVEQRSSLHITDMFVRPIAEKNSAQLYIEVNSCGYEKREVQIKYSLYGQNFNEVVFENAIYTPSTVKTVGMGDSLTEADVKAELGCQTPMYVLKGKNIFKIEFPDENPVLWETDKPFLYQIQAELLSDGTAEDFAVSSFGMRSFTQDTASEKKGMFYLNGKKIRLRGANTMGFEQQDVMRGNIGQLIDDILLAKLCNMNFLRLTQRPVQDEIYEYCDKLGLMTQTDLPLFGCMRRTKVAEGVRQAEEMERIVRKHPCNVLITYINEPFPNANNEPHRHLTRGELEDFFKMCDLAVKIQNPDRVIKHIDGDYDPPTDGLPDNHCYPMWYNGHGIDVGMLNKGYWLPIKDNWYCGCGEYGAEGLDYCDIMREMYPKEWIREPFGPKNIVRAQTADFHRFFYDSQDDMESWVRESQEHQRFATRFMTEAFRRNDNMVSSAIHLFIDAWPSGWMKTIMDCRRNPKPAYFAYRDALSPVLLSLRTDRFTYYSGEKISVECFICNDTNEEKECIVSYELYDGEKCLLSGSSSAVLCDCSAKYCGEAVFDAPCVKERSVYTLRAVLSDGESVISENSINIEVFADVSVVQNDNVIIINPDVGEHIIAGEKVTVKNCGMLPVHFVSRKTGHRFVEGFKEKDFSYWYDKSCDMITPIADKTFTASGFSPVLISKNKDENGSWSDALVCAEKEYEGKRYVICTADLRCENPVAKYFLKRINE